MVKLTKQQRPKTGGLWAVVIMLAHLFLGHPDIANGQGGYVASGGGHQGFVEPASYEAPAVAAANATVPAGTANSAWIRPQGGTTSLSSAPTSASHRSLPHDHVSVLRQATASESNSSSKAKTLLSPPSSDRPGERSAKSGSSFVSVVASLLVVIGLFLACSIGYKRWFASNVAGGAQAGPRLISRTNLGPRQQLAVVEFGPKLVLVSMQQGQVRTLSELTDEADIAAFYDEQAGQGRVGSRGPDPSTGRSRARVGVSSDAWSQSERRVGSGASVVSNRSKGVVAR
ncbi:MAG: flagellar biosynthetic protein FliO [Aureliella sp.]